MSDTDHVIHPFLCAVADLQDTFSVRPPGPPLVGDDLLRWQAAAHDFRRFVDVRELRTRLLYAGGRPSAKVVRSIIDRPVGTRSFATAKQWLADFAKRRQFKRILASLAFATGLGTGIVGNGTDSLPPVAGCLVLVYTDTWSNPQILLGNPGAFSTATQPHLRDDLYLPDGDVPAMHKPLSLARDDLLPGAWTRCDVAVLNLPVLIPAWPDDTTDAVASPPFSLLERVAVVIGGVAFFGVVICSVGSRFKVRVHDPPNSRDVEALAKNIKRAPFALHGGKPPPPRTSPDVRERVIYLTRRDIDGAVSPFFATLTDGFLDSMFALWNTFDAVSTGTEVTRRKSRTVGFDMLEYAKAPTVERRRCAPP